MLKVNSKKTVKFYFEIRKLLLNQSYVAYGNNLIALNQSQKFLSRKGNNRNKMFL